ncbi:MAG: hypothetical protein KDK12_19740 [Rhodobacteraceae bacterium]|nr:hypothetical protein [Paracoccaceae bacterium]
MTPLLPFEELLDRLDARTGVPAADPGARADQQLVEAEEVLEAWLRSKGQEPTDGTVEGFRLLALHRQGAKGDPSFNACRETCRELVYLRNLVAAYDGPSDEAIQHLRLQGMVLRHLALFVGGKMVEAGLGDFCCSSRPVRQRDAQPVQGD